jgi:hypothetical protein
MEGGRRHGKLQSRPKSKVETGLAPSQAAERLNVHLILGGAALQRCDRNPICSPALAAAGDAAAHHQFSPVRDAASPVSTQD